MNGTREAIYHPGMPPSETAETLPDIGESGAVLLNFVVRYEGRFVCRARSRSTISGVIWPISVVFRTEGSSPYAPI